MRRHSHKNVLAWRGKVVRETSMVEEVDTAFYHTGRLDLIGSTAGNRTFVVNLNSLRLCKKVKEVVLQAVYDQEQTAMTYNNTRNRTRRAK